MAIASIAHHTNVSVRTRGIQTEHATPAQSIAAARHTVGNQTGHPASSAGQNAGMISEPAKPKPKRPTAATPMPAMVRDQGPARQLARQEPVTALKWALAKMNNHAKDSSTPSMPLSSQAMNVNGNSPDWSSQSSAVAPSTS